MKQQNLNIENGGVNLYQRYRMNETFRIQIFENFKILLLRSVVLR